MFPVLSFLFLLVFISVSLFLQCINQHRVVQLTGVARLALIDAFTHTHTNLLKTLTRSFSQVSAATLSLNPTLKSLYVKMNTFVYGCEKSKTFFRYICHCNILIVSWTLASIKENPGVPRHLVFYSYCVWVFFF